MHIEVYFIFILNFKARSTLRLPELEYKYILLSIRRYARLY